MISADSRLRSVAILLLSSEQLVECLSGRARLALPDTCTIEAAHYDYAYDSWAVRLASPTFSKVKVGEQIPILPIDFASFTLLTPAT